MSKKILLAASIAFILSVALATEVLSAPPPPPVVPVVPAAGSKGADDAFVAGKFAEAFQLYQTRVLVNPFDLDAHDGVTASAAKMGKVKDAVSWYEKLPSGHAGFCYGAARAVLTDGDRKQASALCYRALDLNRGLGRAYFLLGLLYQSQGVPDYKTAMNAFNRAVELDPKYGPTYYHLAKLQAGIDGNVAGAKALLGKALLYLTPVQNDLRLQTLVLYGGLLSGERDYAAALRQFEAARDLAGDAVYEQVNFGRVYELMGNPDAAEKEWTAVRTRFGLASPTGLQAWKSIRRMKSKAAVDFSDFLPGGAPADYTVLLPRLALRREPQAVAVPTAIARLLDEIKIPVLLKESDVNGDGKVELTVVEARTTWDPDVKGYYLAKPTLHVFTPKGAALGIYESRFEHFWDVALVDFNGDGKKEVVFAGFTGPNVLNLIVLTHQGRRMLSTYAQTVQCVAAPCGVLIDDLDGDGKLEIMTVDGVDLWVTVRRWNDAGTFTDASADFPDFYQDYVKKYSTLRPEDLQAWPVVKAHLREANAILLQSIEKKPPAGAN